MTNLKRLLLLCAGYGAIWLGLFAGSNLDLSIGNPWVETAGTAMLVSVICLYPAAAIGWFYKMQTGQTRWLAASAATIAYALGLNIWAVYQFGEQGLGGYDGLAVLFIVVLGGVPAGILTTGLACSQKIQHRVTCFLGYATLTGAAISLGLVAYELTVGKEPQNIAVIFFGIIGVAIIALLTSAILGTQKPDAPHHG